MKQLEVTTKSTGPSLLVYESLKKEIEEGQIFPGESLREVELSKRFSVSRNTVKKALLMLERDTLVSIEQNKGAKVRTYSLTEVLDFLELRSELEGFIVRIACGVIPDSDIERLRNILVTMKKLKEDQALVSYSAHNRQFHEVIYNACPNRTATNHLVALKNQMKKYNTKTILIPGRNIDSFREHERIFLALEKHDCEQAERLMVTHIMNIRTVFRENHKLLL